MICSMTGFARDESRGAFGTLVWELRTVNHRYLDMSLRLPEELRSLEPECREHVAAVLRRGKLDAQLRFEPVAGGSGELQLDEDQVRAVAAAMKRVAALTGMAAGVAPLELLRWPGVVRQSPVDLQAVGAETLRLLDAGLEKLTAMRSGEGRRTAAMLRERAQGIALIVSEVRGHAGSLRDRLREKLHSRFEELKLSADPARLEQELVLLLQRLDVAEELDRLDSHLTELEAILKKGEAVGRRLDFLMQEFNREANTLGSKSQDSAITQRVVELKVLIEQMREQVQNLE
ncbi:MAG TPA: YicC/YloC family endoribonuclease [Gammaproteobacteria bacterium]|nr:YicC/YloC family endoribonuclease [Gammaproteobacteria bacterium]